VEGGHPRSGDGDLLCLAQLPGALDSVAANGLIVINSITLASMMSSGVTRCGSINKRGRSICYSRRASRLPPPSSKTRLESFPSPGSSVLGPCHGHPSGDNNQHLGL